MSTERNVPKLRFPGFTEPWEQRKFSDIAARESSISTSTTDVPSVEYEDVIAEEGRLNKDIHLKEAVKSGITFDGSQVLYGKLRPYLHNWLNPDFNGIAVGDWWVLKPINMDKKFLYCLIQTQQFDNIANQSSGSKMPRADWNLISNSVFMVPFSKEEQSKIGRYFDSLDRLITLHQRKLKHVKDLKKSMLQKMFPKNGQEYPELRFPGFTEPWEQRKLSDEFNNFIVPMRDKPKEFGGNIPWTRIEDIEGKYLNDSLSGQYVTEETINQMNLKIIPKDSLIVSSSATFGVVAVITQDLITNQTFIGLVPNDKETLDYWYTFFQSDEARKYMRLQSAGSTIFYIARESFENMPIKVSTKDEMIKIGTYFDNLDNLITLHQRELEHFKLLKKGMLQQMFV